MNKWLRIWYSIKYFICVTPIYYDRCKGDCYCFRTSVKGIPTVFLGIRFKIGSIVLKVGRGYRAYNKGEIYEYISKKGL